MLVLSRSIYESIRCNDDITIKVLGVEDDLVAIEVDAPSYIKVVRSERCQRSSRRKKSDAK